MGTLLQVFVQVPARHVFIGLIALESAAKKHIHLASTIFIILVSWPLNLHIDRYYGDLGNPFKKNMQSILEFLAPP